MFECLILGDSIALGTSYYRKECTAIVKSGINSSSYNSKYISSQYTTKTAIISLGVNDSNDMDTYENLLKLRRNIDAEKVFWILPAIKDRKRKEIWMIAYDFNDIVVDSRFVPLSQDRLHPTSKGYKELADRSK